MRITSKGQVTIPQAIREQYGLLPNSEVEFKPIGGRITLVPTKSKASGGNHAVARIRGSLKHLGMTTDELLAMTRGCQWLARTHA